MTEEIVQYFVVNRTLGMSAGKTAAQVAHAATVTTVRCLESLVEGHPAGVHFRAWYEGEMKKVVLAGTEEDLLALEARGAVAIRDAGYTEIPAGSLTVAGLPPMPRSEAKALVGHLKTLR